MEIDKESNEKLINLEDIAKHLIVSKDTICAWVKNSKLPVCKAGKLYTFKISEIEQ